MALATVVKRGTGMPDSDVNEVTRLATIGYSGFVLSAFGAANATQVSNTAIAILVNGSLSRVVASGGTANAIVGTVTTNTSAAYILTYGVAGTVSNIMSALFTTLTGYVTPTVPITNVPLCMILVCATATAFNGGTNSFGDAAYTVSIYNFVGAAGMMLATENLSVVPG